MKNNYSIKQLIQRFPTLSVCEKDIENAYNLLVDCFSNGHKLLIAGNGGSCSDSEHIVGELMKGFVKQRHLTSSMCEELISIDPVAGKTLSNKLQRGLPSISLNSHQSLNTAFINDVENGGEYIFAQQLLNLGKKEDVFLAISTSGNSKNICNASIVAKALGMKIIALSGKNGGKLKSLADVSIVVPYDDTFVIQEHHLPIYHCLCLMLEDRFFE